MKNNLNFKFKNPKKESPISALLSPRQLVWNIFLCLFPSLSLSLSLSLHQQTPPFTMLHRDSGRTHAIVSYSSSSKADARSLGHYMNKCTENWTRVGRWAKPFRCVFRWSNYWIVLIPVPVSRAQVDIQDSAYLDRCILNFSNDFLLSNRDFPAKRWTFMDNQPRIDDLSILGSITFQKLCFTRLIVKLSLSRFSCRTN